VTSSFNSESRHYYSGGAVELVLLVGRHESVDSLIDSAVPFRPDLFLSFLREQADDSTNVPIPGRDMDSNRFGEVGVESTAPLYVPGNLADDRAGGTVLVKAIPA
jgi:hypothetical protein